MDKDIKVDKELLSRLLINNKDKRIIKIVNILLKDR